jgi:hypothetical protein
MPPSVPVDNTAPPELGDRLVALWPEMAGKLGERRSAFLDAAWQQAARHGLAETAAASRYVNLCFAFGPAFEQRPENEWALALLADERLGSAVKLHQLVLRAGHELRRRGGDAAALARTDSALLDTLDARRHAADGDAEPLPRSACDIEAVDLRVLEMEWRHEYQKLDGVWQRLPGPAAPPALRVDAQHPLAGVLCVLSHAKGEGPAARLQVRQLLHGQCGGGLHPALRWLGTHGLARWRGHEARAVSWPVHAMPQPVPSNGLGVALVEETSPDVGLIEAPTCGLRDDGVPLGALRAQVWAYPAHQWLFALQREAAAEQQWPAVQEGPTVAHAVTRCRIERDGAPVDASGWVRGFDRLLPQALGQGLEQLFAAWQQGVQNAAMRATPGLLTGRSALTWGWREGAAGLADKPLMRVLGDLDLGCSIDLHLEGDIDTGGARTHVHLAAHGETRVQWAVAREHAEPPLLSSLMPAVVKFRFPFELSHDPVATDDGIVWSEAGSCTGAIEGVAGLRPRLSGGSGWQWFVRAAVEPVLAPFTVHDPVLGLTRRTLVLLPAMPLLDWSLG